MADQPVTITYDSYSLQDTTVITSIIDGDDSAPKKRIGLYELPVLHGAKKTFEKYEARHITLQGIVKSATASGLVGKLEELKELFTRSDKNLTLTYPGYARIYTTVSVESELRFQRPAYAINIADFTVTLVSPEPWSVQTTVSISGVYSITSPTTQLSVGISGMLDPQPQLYFNTTSSGSRISIYNITTGELIDVPTTFSGSGRSLLIDNNAYSVTLDGVPAPFTGTFPRFPIGINNLIITTYGTAGSAIDQSYDTITDPQSTVDFGGANTWRAQSFTAGKTTLTAIELYLAASSGITKGPITVSIQANSAGKPSGTDLASGTINAISSSTPAWYRATMTAALTVTIGTVYWIVLKSTTSWYFAYNMYYNQTGSKYSGGSSGWTYDGGVTWSTTVYDRFFRVYTDNTNTPLAGKLVIQYNPRRL